MEPREGESLNESLMKKKPPKEDLLRDHARDVAKMRDTKLGGKRAAHNASISKGGRR
jgi:hypothetical protein